jgi:hypothetical protein
MTESQVRLTTSDAVGDDCYPRLIDHLVATLIHADLGAYCDHRDVARAWQPRTAGHRQRTICPARIWGSGTHFHHLIQSPMLALPKVQDIASGIRPVT